MTEGTETTENASDDNANTVTGNEAFKEKLEQETADLSDSKLKEAQYKRVSDNTYLMKADAARAGSIRIKRTDDIVTGVSVHNGNKQVEYNFARVVSRSDSNGIAHSEYVPHPEYKETSITDTSDKKTWKRVQTDIKEQYAHNKDGKPEITTYKSTHFTEIGPKTARTSRSDVSIGERTDTLYTKKGKITVNGSLTPKNGDGYDGTVQVQLMTEDNMIQGTYHYDGTADKDGKVRYTLKSESYHINAGRVAETEESSSSGDVPYSTYNYRSGAQYDYFTTEDGQIQGEVHQYDNSGKISKTKDIEPSKQMKKDFAKYQKAMQKLIQKTTKYKSAQDYMENTPQTTPVTTREVNVQQQSLDYVNQAKQAIQTVIQNKAKSNIR